MGAAGRAIVLAGLLAVAACGGRHAVVPTTDTGTACMPPTTDPVHEGYCDFPADVRAFLDDRDLCDHFLGEPWPEDDSADDRARRQEIVDGVRTWCTGTDRRLDALKDRYRDDPEVMRALSGYETGIESGSE